jgi:hypothetical protein
MLNAQNHALQVPKEVNGVEILINLSVKSGNSNQRVDNVCQYVSIWWWIRIPKNK